MLTCVSCRFSMLRFKCCKCPALKLVKSRNAHSLQKSPITAISLSSGLYALKVTPNQSHYISSVSDKLTSGTNINHEKLDNSRRKFHNPSDEEAELLRKMYSNPAQAVKSLISLFTNDPSEFITVKSRKNIFYGLVWEVVLQFTWPQKFQVTASHTNYDKALDNAYLLACEIFKHWNLVKRCRKKKEQIVDIKQVHQIICKIKSLTDIYDRSFVTMTTMGCINGGQKMWKTKINLKSPFDLSVSSTRSDPIKSQNLALLLLIKESEILVHMLQWVKSNDISQICRRYVVKLYRCGKLQVKESYRSDFVMYIDASRVGFGACLMNNEDSSIRWFSNTWPDKLWDDEQPHFAKRKFGNTYYPKHTSFGEFYALVTALYTWKHKFDGKNILCFSDCKTAVNLVNMVNICEDRFIFTINEHFQKLFKILYDTCKSRNIFLTATYVDSKRNKADILSRDQADIFLRTYPNSSPKSKKTKQLLFWPPLTKGLKPECESSSDDTKKLQQQ